MDLGRIVKKAVEKQNMLAWQFNTIGVSDGITMGTEGTYHISHVDIYIYILSLPIFT